jgi:hypothetical protein
VLSEGDKAASQQKKGGITMNKIVLTVELEEPVSERFDVNTYAKNIAYRALNWSRAVKVTGAGVSVCMINQTAPEPGTLKTK